MSRRCVRSLLGAMAVLVALMGVARAHEPSMALLDLRELAAGNFVGRWSMSTSDRGDGLQPLFPPQCHWTSPQLSCDRPGLVGTIGFEGMGAGASVALIRITTLDGETRTVTLTPTQPRATVVGGAIDWPQRLALLPTYAVLGVSHILLGPDHLLFVLGLLAIVGWRWMLVRTVTAFTVAHSLTLAVATFGWLTPPTAAVNAAIALSILFLGPEMIKVVRGEPTLASRRPYIVAFAFGLLHGFGFASALTDAGLPRGELPWALLGFNLGVELGQLAFILTVAALVRAVGQLAIRFPRWTRPLPAYVVGGLGAFWSIGRVAVILGVVT